MSPITDFNVVYRGSRSMRWADTVGFPAVFRVGVEDGGAFEGIIGVEVDTVMVSGRMVPAMASDEASKTRQG